jgi:hypothetical protein
MAGGLGLVLLAGVSSTGAAGQAPGPGYGQRPQPVDPTVRGINDRDRDRMNTDPLSGRMEQQQAISRNNDRQKKLVSDTEKLLGLATELKQQVDKTDKNTLSVDVIKKAEEIEKLAHNVKERMKGGM